MKRNHPGVHWPPLPSTQPISSSGRPPCFNCDDTVNAVKCAPKCLLGSHQCGDKSIFLTMLWRFHDHRMLLRHLSQVRAKEDPKQICVAKAKLTSGSPTWIFQWKIGTSVVKQWIPPRGCSFVFGNYWGAWVRRFPFKASGGAAKGNVKFGNAFQSKLNVNTILYVVCTLEV